MVRTEAKSARTDTLVVMHDSGTSLLLDSHLIKTKHILGDPTSICVYASAQFSSRATFALSAAMRRETDAWPRRPDSRAMVEAFLPSRKATTKRRSF